MNLPSPTPQEIKADREFKSKYGWFNDTIFHLYVLWYKYIKR